MKKITRSSTNKVLSGVLGGAAESFNMNATLLRILFVLLVLATGIFPGVVLYVIAAVALPESGRTRSVDDPRTA